MTIERTEAIEAPAAAPAPLSSRRGWIVVAVSFVCLTVSAGFGFYSLSTFSSYLTSHNHLNLTVSSAGSTVYMLSSGMGGIVVARLARRFDLRLVMLGGIAVSTATVPFIGLAYHAWDLWLVYLIYGIGASGISMIPASTLVMRFFADAPARPIALATTGMSVGGALVAPLIASLVTAVGLPHAGLVMAAITLGLLTPLVVFVVPATKPVVAQPTTVIQTQQRADDTDADGRSWPLLPGRVVFAGSTLAFGLLMLSQVGAVTHMLTLARERDIPSAATALSFLAGTSVVGRLIGIPVLPRIGLYKFSVANALLQAGAMVAFAFAHSYLALVIASILLGATVGNTVVLFPLVIYHAFGVHKYAQLYARGNMWTSFGVASAPLLVGLIHDHLGGYTVAMIVMAVGSGLSAIILAALRGAKAAQVAVAGQLTAAAS